MPETFAEICAKTGRKEIEFALPVDGSNKVKADICRDKLWLIAKCMNGKKKVDFTDTDQVKYTPWHEIIPDGERPFGFRLAFVGFVSARDYASLGARPPFLKKEDAIYAGKQWVEIWEEWYHYMNLAFQEF